MPETQKKIRAVLQARLSSSRLPAKMLLPVCGMPLIVLCARRATIYGVDVIVATSTDPSDDLLVQTLENYDIPFQRGDLNNVLDRFIQASNDLAEDDLVIRLTGDNPVVDGGFLDELLVFHHAHGAAFQLAAIRIYLPDSDFTLLYCLGWRSF